MTRRLRGKPTMTEHKNNVVIAGLILAVKEHYKEIAGQARNDRTKE